jgi:hypothetical protein
MAMMAITTSNSISVKEKRFFIVTPLKFSVFFGTARFFTTTLYITSPKAQSQEQNSKNIQIFLLSDWKYPKVNAIFTKKPPKKGAFAVFHEKIISEFIVFLPFPLPAGRGIYRRRHCRSSRTAA